MQTTVTADFYVKSYCPLILYGGVFYTEWHEKL